MIRVKESAEWLAPSNQNKLGFDLWVRVVLMTSLLHNNFVFHASELLIIGSEYKPKQVWLKNNVLLHPGNNNNNNSES